MVVTDDPFVLCRAEQIDVLVDLTGSVELGARVVLEAAQNGKHIVLMNAELDATIGPILSVYAEKAGVIMSACDGDEPGLQMNLVRWVEGLGLKPRVIGNVKGLQDPYRNPETQRGFAEKWGQNPAMVTSFADGSKISFEQTIVANATGAKVLQRGMSRGVKFDGSPLELPSLYDLDEIRDLGSIIDYTVGPSNVKVFVLAEHDDPKQRHYLSLYKLGEGPLYPFWIPYHMPSIECPNAIARVVLFGDNLAKPLNGPSVEVCAVAKRDLKAGETLDDYGEFMTYGEAANAEEMSERRLLPEGLVSGCKLLRDIPQGRGRHLRRRRAPCRPHRRPPAGRAVPPLPRRDAGSKSSCSSPADAYPARRTRTQSSSPAWLAPGGLKLRTPAFSNGLPPTGADVPVVGSYHCPRIGPDSVAMSTEISPPVGRYAISSLPSGVAAAVT